MKRCCWKALLNHAWWFHFLCTKLFFISCQWEVRIGNFWKCAYPGVKKLYCSCSVANWVFHIYFCVLWVILGIHWNGYQDQRHHHNKIAQTTVFVWNAKTLTQFVIKACSSALWKEAKSPPFAMHQSLALCQVYSISSTTWEI